MSTPTATTAGTRPRSPLDPIVEALESASALDGPARALGARARALLGREPLKPLLSGAWLGHPVHPLLTDVVVGALLSANVLDMVGGDPDRRARHRLIAVALAAAPPTALTGTSDWADAEPADDGVRRSGLVHALSNTTALALYAGSLAAGRRRAVMLRLGGAAVLGAGAYLGGHLSFAKGVGVDR